MIINPYIYGVATSYDPDAQAFITASGISGTEANAINQWVVDSKAAGIWTKFKAVYPMVGGTATSCKWNLKDARDLDAAFRLTFTGGGTFSANGYQPNGINSYANPWFMLSVNSTASNISAGVYSRTNNLSTGVLLGGSSNAGEGTMIFPKTTGPITYYSANNYATNGGGNFVSDTRGFFIVNKFSASITKLYRNGLTIATANPTTGNIAPAAYVFIGARAVIPSIIDSYDNRENAFSFIGDTLTDLESQLFYQITEKYQVALSRNVNTTQSFYYNSAYNNETNAFLFSTQITDNTIQTATNTLVSDLKTANIFTKMKAIYPMVGGTATTCKFNLVNAQDTDAAYRLAFGGGGTFSSNGYLPNGVNSFANTYLIPRVNLTNNNNHISFYSRTDTNGLYGDMGSSEASATSQLGLYGRYLGNSLADSGTFSQSRITAATANSLGFYTSTRTANNVFKLFKNGSSIGTNITTNTVALLPNQVFTIGGYNENGVVIQVSIRQCAFASIGDGLTDAEALALYNAVQTFNTTLARQV